MRKILEERRKEAPGRMNRADLGCFAEPASRESGLPMWGDPFCECELDWPSPACGQELLPPASRDGAHPSRQLEGEGMARHAFIVRI
jgi:hypothetical protein